MKIALIGYGKMGKIIHELAEARGYSIAAIIDSKSPLKSGISTDALRQADVCIDFSIPSSVLENVKTLSSMKKNIVLGTTGWYENLPEITKIIEKESTGLFYSPNFSLGIALFLKLLEQTAGIMAQFDQYEPAGIEMHHSKKKDAPSGTAQAITERLNRHLNAKPIVFSSVRVGNMPGTHSVIYDSPFDTITLTHAARSRDGFAEGALAAAQWLDGKKGIFTMNDMLKERIP